MIAAGCGGAGLRHDFLGRGGASIATDGSMPAVSIGASAAPGAGGIAVRAGDQLDLTWTITQPRAERVRYAIACAGTSIDPGEVGETFDEYRTRRIAELRAQRDRDRQAVSSVASALLPSLGARTRVATPTADATAEVHVDRRAMGDAVAAGVVADDVALPPGDVGAGTLTGTLRIDADADGACAMTVFTDTPGVTGTFAVTRVVDVAAERRARDAAARQAALTARGAVTASLTARGAKVRSLVLPVPEVVDYPAAPVVDTAALEAHRRHRAELDARIAARIEIERRDRDTSLVLRGAYIRYLVGECHADPEARQKRRDEETRRRQLVIELRARRLRIAVDLRARLRAQLIGFGADPDYQRRMRAEAAALAAQAEARARAAFEARAAAQARAAADAAAIAAAATARDDVARMTRGMMIEFLLGLGARLRPPMPDPVPEDPGYSPFAGAVWEAGVWFWTGGQWVWRPGGWRDGSGGFGVDTTVDNGRDTGWVVRDHRDPDPSTPTIHLVPTQEPRGGGQPQTRDHRGGRDGGADGDGSGVIRDHRTKDKDKDKDKADSPRSKDDERSGMTVRDHRR